MDEYTSRNGSGLVLRDTAKRRDKNALVSNRAGCSGRPPNSLKPTQNVSTEKTKSSRLPFRSSSSGKEIIGSSSKAYPAVRNPKMSCTVPQKKLLSLQETDSSESSSVQDDEPEVSEPSPPPGKIQRGGHHNSGDAESSQIVLAKTDNSCVASSTKTQRNLHKKTGLSTEDSIKGFSEFWASKNTAQAACAKASRYGLRNLRCNSVSDVLPSGCSSSDSSLIKRKILVKKRNCEGECSSCVSGQKMIGPSSGARCASFSHGISISGSRRTKNIPPNRDNDIASVRIPRSTNGYNQGNRSSLLSNESPVVIQQVSQPEIPNDGNVTSPIHQFSAEASSSRRNLYSRSGRSETFRSIMTAAPTEVGSRSSINRDSFRHYNVDGIAEVLMALERIGQDVELSNEQLAVLETNLFLSGLNIFDQHRELRLDIDNMSYEELLALEERMGSVSTALTEEELSQCLNINIYQSILPSDARLGSEMKEEDKCSICQEAYVVGDEVGSLHCKHKYHVACIQNWLKLKNWCPICKSPAAPSKSDQWQET